MEVIEMEFLIREKGKIKSRFVYAPIHKNGKTVHDVNRLCNAAYLLHKAGCEIVGFEGAKQKSLLFIDEVLEDATIITHGEIEADAAFHAGYNKALNDVMDLLKGQKK